MTVSDPVLQANKLDLENRIIEVWNKGLSIKVLSERLNVTSSKVKYVLKKHKIKIEKRITPIALECGTGVCKHNSAKIDQDFFDKNYNY